MKLACFSAPMHAFICPCHARMARKPPGFLSAPVLRKPHGPTTFRAPSWFPCPPACRAFPCAFERDKFHMPFFGSFTADFRVRQWARFVILISTKLFLLLRWQHGAIFFLKKIPNRWRGISKKEELVHHCAHHEDFFHYA